MHVALSQQTGVRCVSGSCKPLDVVRGVGALRRDGDKHVQNGKVPAFGIDGGGYGGMRRKDH